MVVKEWRDAWWKLFVAAVPVVLLVFLLSPYEEFVEMTRGMPGVNPVEVALRDISDLYYMGGFIILLPLAAFLGVASVSGEVSNDTILLLLSRPLSRARLLLIKYAIGAGTLLIAAVLGKALLIVAAALRGYPLGQLRVLEAVLSVFVLWLGVLFVFGTALLVSVIFRSVIASLVACTVALLLVFALPYTVFDLLMTSTAARGDLSQRLTLLTYWMPSYYYHADGSSWIGGFSYANFLVCLIAAVVPLSVALWLFNKRAY